MTAPSKDIVRRVYGYDEPMRDGAGKTEEQVEKQAARRKVVLRESRRLLLLIPGIVAVVLVILARGNAQACEQVFSRGIYPWLSSAIAFLPGFVSFSVAQWFVILAVPLVVSMLAYYVVQVIRKSGMRLRFLFRLLTSTLGIVSLALFFYAMLCGLNYYRCTFAQNEGFEVEQSTTEELTALCSDLAGKLNSTRAELPVNLDEYIAVHGGFGGYAARSVIELETLANTYETLRRPYYSQPKPVTIFSGLMSDGDITGMYFAYTVESNVNVDPPFYTIPATMVHELAHQCGYMREDEANFIAYLACEQSGDPLIRYSGLSMAYSYAISALAQVDPTASQQVASTLSGTVRADHIENRQFWASHDGPLREVAQQANDAYLKANDQTDGTRSYGRMVDLLLASRRPAQAPLSAIPLG